MAKGDAACCATNRTCLGVSAGSCAQSMTQYIAFCDATACAGLGCCTGGILPAVTQSCAAGGATGLTSLSGGACSGIPIVAQGSTLSDATGATGFCCSTSGSFPIVTQGSTLCYAAGGTDVRFGTSSPLPAMAQCSDCVICIAIAAAASIGGIAITGAGGFGHYHLIVLMDVLQGGNGLLFGFLTKRTGVEHFALFIFCRFDSYLAIIPRMPQSCAFCQLTCAAGLRLQAGCVLPGVAKGIAHFDGTCTATARGAPICICKSLREHLVAAKPMCLSMWQMW